LTSNTFRAWAGVTETNTKTKAVNKIDANWRFLGLVIKFRHYKTSRIHYLAPCKVCEEAIYHSAPKEEAITQKSPKGGGSSSGGASYKAAGVDIDAGNALVEAIKPLVKSTDRPGVASELGGFGGLFDLKAAGYTDPMLAAATDGVGTKLLIAGAAGHHETIGIDLVAMCVNDLVVQGAEPLFFLDYLATGKLEVDAGRELIAGIADGCKQAGCALIGGETAEMAGLYGPGHYDLAGFAVGAVERDRLLRGDEAKPGDVIFGLASSGLHSNGFSLVRRIVEDNSYDYAGAAPFDDSQSLGRALLEPTRIYVKSCLKALATGGVHGFAHITGGGLLENIPRVLPAGLTAAIDTNAWPLPSVFRWLAKTGAVMPQEMARTFNCGIGMVVLAAPGDAGDVEAVLSKAGEYVIPLGTVRESSVGEDAVILDNLGDGWPP